MYELIDMFETNPNRKAINLEFKNMKDLTQMVNLLTKFPNLFELRLHGNKLTYLPKLESLANLKILDISNNPIKIDNYLLDNLFLMPSLEDLTINATKQDSKKLIEQLPRLKILNGETITRYVENKNSTEEFLNNQIIKLNAEMERIRSIYHRLSKSLDQGGQAATSSEQQFQFLYRDISQEMSYFYTGLQDKLSKEGVFAYCKNKLTSILDNHLIRLLEENGLETVTKIVEEINRIKNQNFDYLLKIIFSASYETYMDEEIEKPTNRLRKQTLYQQEIFRLKKETIELRKENRKIDQLSQYQEESQPSKTPKSQVNRTPKSQFSKTPNTQSKAKLINTSKSPSMKNLKKSQENNFFKKNDSSRSLSKSLSKKSMSKGTASIKNLNHSVSTGKAAQVGCKIVSLEQLLGLIEEIMNEKVKFNLRCLQKKEEYETAQQFIFTFFSRRYGLKQIALDWSLSLIRSIEIYCKDSIQIEIFGKVLKNHIYEEYYLQGQLFAKEIANSLKIQKIKPSSQIDESQFKRLFFTFFSFEDLETFEKIAKSFKFPVNCSEAIYFLECYKLTFEEKHLRKYMEVFKKLDSNDDSALTASQSKQLIELMIKDKNQNEEEQKRVKNALWKNIDLLKKDKIIFSELFQMVHAFI